MFRFAALAVVPLLFACPVFAEEVHCPGGYGGHLQGVAVDGAGNIYWSFTVALVKTDASGELLCRVAVPTHHGDLWVHKGRVYVAMNHHAEGGKPGERVSWLYVYRAEDLTFLWRKGVPQVVEGAGALTVCDGHIFIASGRVGKGSDHNVLYEYDLDANFVGRHVLESGGTFLGIQTMAYREGTWWFGCYGKPPETLRAEAGLVFRERFDFDCANGIAPLADGGFYIGRGARNDDRQYTGWVIKVDRPTPAK